MLFFPMGSLLGQRFFSQSDETIDDLKEAIRRDVALIPPSMLRKVRENFIRHLEYCMDNNGADMPYLQKLIRKTHCVIDYSCKILTM